MFGFSHRAIAFCERCGFSSMTVMMTKPVGGMAAA